MSADGQGDTENLKKGEDTPAATVPEGIPSISTIDESDSRHTLVDQNTPQTLGIKADNCNDDNLEESLDEIENIIEKKLPKDKEKALDEDSELDFELKWDDDTDLNDDQANDIGDIDLDIVEREDSTLKSAEKHLEKDLDQETDSILTCIENDLVKGLDNADEEANSVLTSLEKDLEKDLDSTDKETQSELTSIDEGLDTLGKDTEATAPSIEEVLDNADKEVESTLTSVDEGLDSVGKEIDTSNIEKSLDNADKEMQSPEKDLDNIEQKKENTTSITKDLNNLEFRADDNMDINTNIMDIASAEEAKSKPEDNALDLEVDKSGIEVQAFNVDTTKIDLESKTPSTESETNSLDEQLVYSDAEAPDIDDKELLDEIDAQITEAEKNINELGIADSAKASILLEPSTSQESNDDKKSQKDTSEMDVDVDLIDVNPVKEPDPNDTSSSVPDTDTSSYDINNEHRLDKPDVMIEIPTQELIESFDDSEETSDADKSDNDPNKPDLIKNTISEHNENLTEPQASGDKNDTAKPISDKDDTKNVFDKLLTDEDTAINKNKLVSDAPIENMEVDSNASEEINLVQKIPENNSNEEVIKPDQENVDSALEEKVTHADIILEANSEPEVVSAANTASDPDVKLGENKNDEEVKSSEVKNIEDVTKATTDVDEVQPSTSKTKYHQESSDEDQEVTDSLGLLAESSRVMEDDDEQEQEPDDDDDDDDFDQDDESNQMTAEHSEDSNAQHSETDVPKETMDVDESNDAPEPLIDDVAETHDIEEAGDESHEAFENEAPVDESSGDKDDFQIQIGTVVGGNTEVEVQDSNEATDATEDSLEVQKAVDTILEDKMTEESSDVPTASVEETVKLSDSDSDGATKGESSKLRNLLLRDSDSSNETPVEKKSPSKIKKLEISKPKNEINIVELEESSSEDDIQVVNKQAPETPTSPKDVTSADIPTEVGVTAAGGDTVTPPGEGGDPTTAASKPASLNTEEVATKAASAAEPPAISETTAPKTPEAKTPVDLSSEIFSLDSDDEETSAKSKRKKRLTAVEIDKTRETNKCINTQCTSDPSVPLVPASVAAVVYYAASQQRGGLCVNCAQRMAERSEKLIEGVKDLTPYLNMDMCMIREEFVEISDSDSDEEPDLVQRDDEIIGEEGAKFLEEHLADMFNDTWKKFDMEARLLTAQAEISVEVGQMEEECKKIDAMLHECQMETDKLRNDLYDTFADERRELPGITIYDTPVSQWSGLEEVPPTPIEKIEPRQPKRRLPPPPEPPAKRAPIPLGYTPLDSDSNKQPETKAAPAPLPDVIAQPEDDNADISVVKLCVESAPAGLPGPGVATRPPLRPNMSVYAMRNAFGAWHRVRIVEVQPKVPGQFTMCRVRFEHPKNASKLLPARCLAYEHAPDVRLTIGTRVVALFKDHRMSLDKKDDHIEKKEAYYSGIVAEIPNPVNNYRYLIFFDDGYAQYVQHAVTRLVCECAPRVWDEVHPFSRQFVRDYLRAYPERPMVRLHAGQSIKTEWNGKWWPSKVIQVDASLVHVLFEGKKEGGVDKTEWIYRGSTRLAPLYLELQAAERQRSRPLPRAQAGRRFNMPYVEYTRSDETAPAPAQPPPVTPAQTQAQIEQEIRRQRAVAKKSTALPAPQAARENVTSRVVFYTPKNAIRPLKMTPHTCGPQCKRTDVLALKDLRTYNPLAKPLLTGWERHQVRFRSSLKAIMYRAPCGRRIRDYRELHYYLQAINSDMGVDLFDFNPATHCLSEFLLNKCLVSKKDLSHGKENVPVPCVNYYDDSLPEFCSYNTERTPTAGVPLNLDPEFLCGCDCTDDCADKSKCACWKMTLEGARTIGLDTDEVGYVYKRLPEPLPSGIYECNSRCKCKQTCLNRVAQHPLQLKLQVFKTANRGWGIRALNDVPKGAFLCVYAGNLLTDATANLDGLNEGDEYLAELDYIEVVEQMKEGFEEDIPEDAKKLDQESSSPASSSSSESEPAQDADDDFRPVVADAPYTPSEYSKRLRKRDKSNKKAKEKEEKAKKEKDGNTDDCITISDDEELREPARFAARAGMGGKEFISKYKSVRAHFGKDEACYIMDAKVQGNIGRYLNHSCTPNVFVQNVFVDTHDPRFPWVAFFALSQITAGTELTWNYNYDVGSVPGKVLYCYCNAHNCRGRLL